MTLVKTAILSGALVAIAPGIILADLIEKKGTSPYVTHFIFRPVQSLEVSGLGTATLLEAVGTTQNIKGEKMFDKMSARCTALSVDSGAKKYIDGACVLADADGDKIFSTFDTRDVDKSQPSMGSVPISSRAAPANMRGLLGVSHLRAMQCLRWLGRAAIPRWTFLIIRHGRLSSPDGATASDVRPLTERVSPQRPVSLETGRKLSRR